MTGEDLREAREKLGMSQVELARLLGYKDKSSISRLESGDRDINPRQEMLILQSFHTISKRRYQEC